MMLQGIQRGGLSMATSIQTSPSSLISNTLLLTQTGLALPIQEASLPQPELLPTITSVSFARPNILLNFAA